MLEIKKENLFSQMRTQNVMGARIFDTSENLVFSHIPESQKKSLDITNKCIASVKDFLTITGNTKLIIRLKKFSNTKEDLEVCYLLIPLNETETTHIQGSTTTQANNPDPVSIKEMNAEILKRVNEKLDRIKNENEVKELRAQLTKSNEPWERVGTILGVALEKVADIGKQYMENMEAKAPTMQGTETKKPKEEPLIEDAEILSETKELTEQEEFEQAVQLLSDAGVRGSFLLALAKKVKANPKLIDLLAMYLKIPK